MRQVEQLFQIRPTHTSLLPPATPGQKALTAGQPIAVQPPQLLLPASLLPAAPLAPCSVLAILNPLIPSAQAIAQERGLILEVDLPDPLPPVHANLKTIQEAISNVIENALKYTPAGGQIWIHAYQDHPAVPHDDTVTIAISDTGPGISPGDQTHIFERHYRGSQAESDIPGSGLGLAIAHDLVQQMQGGIQVISPAQLPLNSQPAFNPNYPGTTFLIWLPVSHSVIIPR
ncbi:sensor histidine kinase [Neosynechococcus sphagnicola]|uniref:sensor histidine kinase n=1 Tax=Neosynechococcus sphagnicola TaxID=1501145 RepID=UPI00068F5FED|nr:ATP-binding protein [Neosynechococcus sphagnicola]